MVRFDAEALAGLSAKERAQRKSLWKKIKKAIKNAVKFVWDGVKNAAQFIADTLAKIKYTYAQFVDKLTDMVEKVANKVLPHQLAKLASLILLAIDYKQYLDAAFLQNIANVLETGDITQLFDFISPSVAALVEVARNQARPKSKPTPEVVKEKISDKPLANEIGDNLRYCTLKDIDDKPLWKVWGELKGDREAICLIDTIVFVNETDFRGVGKQDDVFTYVHEVQHYIQFKAMGTVGFVREYLQKEMTKDGINPMEEAADLFACQMMPYGSPHYIKSCPIPA